jgi:hypothetical protein
MKTIFTENFYITMAIILLLDVAIIQIVYRSRHPELTETQRLLNFFEGLLVGIILGYITVKIIEYYSGLR